MLAEIRKSIAAILYERTTSPFYGTLIIAWLLINWQIPYLTFFEEALPGRNKIETISQEFSDPWFLYFYPLISTFALITIVPVVTNGAYWISQKYEQIRIRWKNEISGETLITKNQYVDIQEELARKQSEYEETLELGQKELNELRELRKQERTEKLTFRIIHGIYGRRGVGWRDVTRTLNSSIGGSALNIPVANVNLDADKDRDPAPGHWKELFVTYQFEGEIKSVSAVEGDRLEIVSGFAEVSAGRQTKWIDEAIFQKQHAPETQEPKSQ